MDTVMASTVQHASQSHSRCFPLTGWLTALSLMALTVLVASVTGGCAVDGEAGNPNQVTAIYSGDVAGASGRNMAKLQANAAAGNIAAQDDLANAYEMAADGLSQSYPEALYWWGKAAAAGDATAMINIGMCYYSGLGVAQNYAEAAAWARKAADSGSTGGMYSIGRLYYHGQGVPQDYTKAFYWMRKSAAGGNQGARMWLRQHVQP